PAERAAALAYLNRINTFQNPDDFRVALVYVQRIGTRPEELNNSLAVLTGGELDPADPRNAYRQFMPVFFRDLPIEERQKIAGEIRAFWAALGKIKWADPDLDRDYVFNQFVEVGPDARQALVRYIDTLPADPAEREKLLNYLEYWNSDPREAMRIGYGIFSV